MLYATTAKLLFSFSIKAMELSALREIIQSDFTCSNYRSLLRLSLEPNNSALLNDVINHYLHRHKKKYEQCQTLSPTNDNHCLRKEVFIQEHNYKGPDPKLSRDDTIKLSSLHNKFRGNKIFIVGNGPSLNKIDLEKLNGEYVFMLNRCELIFERISWRPQFYCAFDLTVVPDNLDEFEALDIPYKFFATKHKGALSNKPNHYFYHDKSDNNDLVDRFGEDLQKIVSTGFGGGGTVTTTAIQIAFFMGFDPIYLIGCDCSYKIMDDVAGTGDDRFKDGVPLFLKSASDNDENHFDPRYFGKNKKWHNPNADGMIIGFEKCFYAINGQGRSLFNATPGGRLDAVPRVDYQKVTLNTTRNVSIGVALYQKIASIPTGMRSAIFSLIKSIKLISPSANISLLINDSSTDLLKEVKHLDVNISLVQKNVPVVPPDFLIYPFNNLDNEGIVFENTDFLKIGFVHDLIPIHFNYKDSIQKEYLNTINQCDIILTPSEEIKRELRQYTSNKIIVVPPSIESRLYAQPASHNRDNDFLSLSDIKKRCNVKFDYMIYPAAFRKHKNHEVLLKAIRYVYTNLSFVFCTGETHNNKLAHDLIARIESLDLSHRVKVVLGMNRKEYLSAIYHSKAMIFPSLMEGFGIPVLEAQSLGVPVISSTCGALASTSVGAMIINNPNDHREISNHVNNVYEDNDLKLNLIEAGLKNKNNFTPEVAGSNFLKAIFCS